MQSMTDGSKRIEFVKPALEPAAAVAISDLSAITFVDVKIQNVAAHHGVIGIDILCAAHSAERHNRIFFVDDDLFVTFKDQISVWADIDHFASDVERQRLTSLEFAGSTQLLL